MSQVSRRINRTPGRPDVIRVLLVDDVENVRADAPGDSGDLSEL